MGVDERLRRELGSLAPADPSGAYERVVEKRIRRGLVRRVQIVAVAAIVIVGSTLGVYGLLKVFGVGSHATPAVSPPGGILFSDLEGEQADIFVVRPDGSGLRNLTHDEASELDAVWSPDGRRIAFLRSDLTAGTSAVYVMNADGTGLEQVTESGRAFGGPTWSPDGTRIAYVDQGLWVISAEGGEARLLVEGNWIYDPTWSPDGKSIAYSIALPEPGDELSGVLDLWVVPAEGGDPTQLTHTLANKSGADWSPDGGRIVFTYERDIAVLDLGSGEVRLLTGSEGGQVDAYDRDPAWSPDGSQIVFASDRGEPNVMRLYRMNDDGSDQALVLDRAFTHSPTPDWAGDTSPIAGDASPLPAGPTELAGVGRVCGLSSVQGNFLGEGRTGVAYVYTQVDDTGGCPPEGAGTHALGLDVGSGRVTATSSPLECGLGECSAFAAPDIDGDGRAEIAIRVPSSGVPWDFVTLYRVTGPVGGLGDGAPAIEQIAVEEPATPRAGVEPGPLTIPWGSSRSDVYGAECWSTTDGTDPDIPVLVLVHATPDGAGGWDQRYVELMIEGSIGRVFDVIHASNRGADLPTRYADAFCGSPIRT